MLIYFFNQTKWFKLSICLIEKNKTKVIYSALHMKNVYSNFFLEAEQKCRRRGWWHISEVQRSHKFWTDVSVTAFYTKSNLPILRVVKSHLLIKLCVLFFPIWFNIFIPWSSVIITKNLLNWKFERSVCIYALCKSQQEITVLVYKIFFSSFQRLEKTVFLIHKAVRNHLATKDYFVFFLNPGRF